MEAVVAILGFTSIIVGCVAFIGIIYPIRRLGLKTRTGAVGVFSLSLATFIFTTIITPQPGDQQVMSKTIITPQPGDQQVMANTSPVSERFTLKWQLDETDLLLAIDTHLADTTEVFVTADRVYFEVGNSEAYSRVYFDEGGFISEWRTPRQIPIDDEAWKADLVAFQAKMGSISSDVAFEIDRIENHINARAVVFGSEDIKDEIRILLPLTGTPPPKQSRHIPYDGLRKGESYRLQRVTSLMPRRHVKGLSAEEVMQEIQKSLGLPKGQVIRVIAVDQSNEYDPWYKVELVGNERVTGWIDSGAFIGVGVLLE